MSKNVLGDGKGGDIIDILTRQDDMVQELKEKANFGSLLRNWGFNVSGSKAMINCPFHDDKTPSLSIDVEKKLFNCFGCGKKGDMIDFIRAYKGVRFSVAVDILKKEVGVISTPASVFKPAETKRIEPVKEESKPEPKEPALPAEKKNPEPVKEEKPTENEPALSAEEKKPPSEPSETPPDNSVQHIYNRRELVGSVLNIYHEKLLANETALAFLEKRGLADLELIKTYRLGFCDGKGMKEKCSGDQKRTLHEVGFLDSKMREFFINSIVFPVFDSSGELGEAYARRIHEKPPRHRYLPGKHSGVFNSKAFKVYDEIIFTESIIDALSLIKLGIKNVSACYGTNGFTPDHLELLKDNQVKEVIIAFDNDDAGREGASKLSARLLEARFKVREIYPEAKDWNDDFLAGAKKASVETKIKEAEVKTPRGYIKELEVTREGVKYFFKIGEITYRVQGVKELFVSNLRVNIKAIFGGETFYDNVDLYSSRSRACFVGNLSGMFELTPSTIENALVAMLEYFEKERDKYFEELETKNMPVELTEEERALGLDFLKSPDLFDQVVNDLDQLGYVGEDLNKQLMYIAASSRKLDDPISIMVLSQSSSGKSFLVDTVKKLMPEEDVIAVTSLSDQALNYLPEGGLLHKFLVMGEAVYSDSIEHQIREMLSGHQLSRLVTMKDPKTGKMVSKNQSNEVIVSAVMSSTNHNVNPENASRCFTINADETSEQTKRIHQSQKNKYSLERYNKKKNMAPGIIKKHQCAQRLLRKIMIVNPFAEHLNFPADLVRTRRDHDRFVDLIACVAFLRQYQKEVLTMTEPATEETIEYIECDLEDYRIAYEIMVQAVLKATYAELPKSITTFYEDMRKVLKEEAEAKEVNILDIRITQRDLRKKITWIGGESVKKFIRKLVSLEYLQVAQGNFRGGRNSYQLVADEEIERVDFSMIPAPDQIEKVGKVGIFQSGPINDDPEKN